MIVVKHDGLDPDGVVTVTCTLPPCPSIIAGSAGTTTDRELLEITLILVVVTPPKETWVAPEKLLPETTTFSPPPMDPLLGEMELTEGAGEFPPSPSPSDEHALATSATTANTTPTLLIWIIPPDSLRIISLLPPETQLTTDIDTVININYTTLISICQAVLIGDISKLHKQRPTRDPAKSNS
jgi:hypothetical protein